MAIITTAEYKTYAGIADTGFDTRLGVLIPAVQDHLEDHCGRAFDETTYTDAVFDGNGEASMWLNNAPVTAVSAVKVKSSDGTTTTLDSTAYRFRSNGELYRFGGNDSDGWDHQSGFGASRGSVWSDSAPGNILISYTGGWATMPVSLQYLMYQLVDAAIDRAGDSWMVGSTGDGTESKTYLNPLDLDSRFASLAQPWKRVMA